MTVGQVQEKILSSSGTIPLIIQNLATRNLLVRLKDERDKRCCILQLTEQGKELISEVYPKNEEMILNEFQIYNKEEKKEFLRLLKKYKEQSYE